MTASPARLQVRPRRRLRVGLLLLLVLTGLGCWLGIRSLAAYGHLSDARASLVLARTALLDGRPDEARAAIEAAGRDTQRARALTSDLAWRACAAVPVVGASFEQVRTLTVAADDVARQVLPPALSAAEALRPEVLRRADGSLDLALLGAARPLVTRSTGRVRDVDRSLAAAPAGTVVPAVVRATGDLRQQVRVLEDALQAAERSLRIAPTLLGADRPRRYLLLVQQTSESRGTGGLPGGYAVLEARAGRLSVTGQGSNADLVNGPVPVPTGVPQEYAGLYADNGAFELWQNVNLSPDLPTVARVVEARWRAQGGAPLDGVVTLDGVALTALLQGSQPLTVAGRGVPVDQLARFLAVEQYRGVPLDQQSQRKDSLAEVAALVSDRLARGQGDSRALLEGLVAAVRSGHVRMASDDPALGPALREAGVDGALPRGDAPFAYAVVNNASAGKLDHFLDRRVRYTAGPCDGRTRRTTTSVALTNRAPASGLPPYLTIRTVNGRTTQSTQSSVLLQVYATRGATLAAATLDGEPLATEPTQGLAYLSTAVEQGLPLWYLQLDLPRETTRELVLVLDEPNRTELGRVLEQPLARPLQQSLEAPPCRASAPSPD